MLTDQWLFEIIFRVIQEKITIFRQSIQLWNTVLNKIFNVTLRKKAPILLISEDKDQYN